MKDSSVSGARKPMNCGKITWKDGTSMKQFWPFKASIIHYIAENPSTAKCYLKMAQSCKYFFEAMPIIIVPRMINDNDDESITILCPNNCVDCDGCEKKEGKGCTKISLNKLLHKLWITERLDIDFQPYIPLIRTKIYRCEVTVFGISNTEIMFDDFKFMTLFAEEISIWRASIKYSDEKDVTLDKIIEFVPNLKFMDLEFGNNTSMINTSTMGNILKLQKCKNLEWLIFKDIPESLNIQDLSAFLKKYKNVEIFFYFNENISDACKSQLDALIDEIIESGVPRNLIVYDDQDKKKLEIMESRRQSDSEEYKV